MSDYDNAPADPHHGGKIWKGPAMSKGSIELPADVWRSVAAALADYMRFGPGELDADYIPDEHLEKCSKAIAKAVGEG